MPHPIHSATIADDRSRALLSEAAERRSAPRLRRRLVVPSIVPADLMELPVAPAMAAEPCQAA
ncbi:MAG TPA: hypothetical protein VGB14_01160 [Acidimicrobiales bacterium]|jgi:hypothetical protein